MMHIFHATTHFLQIQDHHQVVWTDDQPVPHLSFVLPLKVLQQVVGDVDAAVELLIAEQGSLDQIVAEVECVAEVRMHVKISVLEEVSWLCLVENFLSNDILTHRMRIHH